MSEDCLCTAKFILSSVLKALKVVTISWMSQSSYIRSLEETAQHGFMLVSLCIAGQ